MRSPKSASASWTVPGALAAMVLAGLLISLVVGGSSAAKPAAREPSATILRVAGTRTPGRSGSDPGAVMAALALKEGAYHVSATFKAVSGQTMFHDLQCFLALPGTSADFILLRQTPSVEETVVLRVAGKVRNRGKAELRCSGLSAPAVTVSEIELTAIQGKVKVRTVP